MPLEINFEKNRKGDTMADKFYILKERTEVNADQSKILKPGSKESRYLLGPVGKKIPMALAEKLGLVKDGECNAEAAAKAAQEKADAEKKEKDAKAKADKEALAKAQKEAKEKAEADAKARAEEKRKDKEPEKKGAAPEGDKSKAPSENK